MMATIERPAEEYADMGRALLEPPAGNLEAEREFVRLFLSPQGAVCPPWQSVYMTEEGEAPRLMGAAHHSALAWFRRFGFEPASETEPADHAGLLLLFYAHLIESGAGRDVFEAFESAHLQWLSRFSARLKSAAAIEPYVALAEIMDETFTP